MTYRPITEDDLNAYVDEVLSPERQVEVVAYLETHPELAARVETFTKQRDMLRATLAPIAAEPVPPELSLARMIERHQRRRLTPWLVNLAASIVLVLIGGAAGWGLHATPQPSSDAIASLASAATDNYAVYAQDRVRPVELRAADQAQLIDWASERLGRSVSVPDLAASGYRFMGGRLVATPDGAAVLYMYDDDHGTRLVLLARPVDSRQTVPMTQHARGAIDGFTWANNGLGYSLVGPPAPDMLHTIADEARRQLDIHA